MKGMMKTAGKFMGVFLVILIAMYFLYPYLNPQKKQDTTKNDRLDTTHLTNNPFDYNLETSDSLKTQIDDLKKTIDSLTSLRQEYQVKVDSLAQLASEMEVEPEDNNTSEPNDGVASAEQFKDISRSLLELDEQELSPILDRLDNDELIGLYKSANNMQRSKMLRSLGSDKAAVILKEII